VLAHAAVDRAVSERIILRVVFAAISENGRSHLPNVDLFSFQVAIEMRASDVT